MAQVGNKCPGLQEFHTFESGYCINECPPTRQCVPPSVLVHIQNKLRVDKHQGDYVSVTSLLGCLRQLYLERRIEYFEEPPKNWYSIRGTLLHNILENPGFESLVADARAYVYRLFERGEANREDLEKRWIDIEARLMDFAGLLPKANVIPDWEPEIEYEFPLGNINGKPRRLKGTIDVLRRAMGYIYDYKTIGDKGLDIIKKGAKEDHITQFNMYRFLVERGYPVGMSYETYHAPKIKGITAFYMTMMQVVGTGRLLSENTAWLVDGGTGQENLFKKGEERNVNDGVIVGDPETIGIKEELKTKKGKRSNSNDPDDFELKSYRKFRVTYAIPEVPLMDLDEVEKLIRKKAPVLFDAFERGIMPPMVDEKTREWKCDDYCPVQIRQACDRHNEAVGELRVTKPKSIVKTKELIPVGDLVI